MEKLRSVVYRWTASIALVSVVVLGFSLHAMAQQSTGKELSPQQKSEVEALVREYILRNPEVILEAIQNLRAQESRRQEDRVQQNLAVLRKELEYSRSAPVGGNPDGDVVIVEFFDYRCPYCKQVGKWVKNLIKEDGNIRYVFREFPILGETSVLASRLALAAWELNGNNYPALHDELMNAPGNLTEARIGRIIERHGYDFGKVREHSQSEEIQKLISRNHELAQALQLTGTPAFIINGKILRGAIPEQAMKEMVADARVAGTQR